MAFCDAILDKLFPLALDGPAGSSWLCGMIVYTAKDLTGLVFLRLCDSGLLCVYLMQQSSLMALNNMLTIELML